MALQKDIQTVGLSSEKPTTGVSNLAGSLNEPCINCKGTTEPTPVLKDMITVTPPPTAQTLPTKSTTEQYFPVYLTFGNPTDTTGQQPAPTNMLDEERKRKILIYAGVGLLFILIAILFFYSIKSPKTAQ